MNILRVWKAEVWSEMSDLRVGWTQMNSWVYSSPELVLTQQQINLEIRRPDFRRNGGTQSVL